MKRVLRTWMLVALALCGFAYGARGFSLLGPFKPWQVERIGYNFAGDIGGPMNLSEDYRWNTPVITYAYDQSFLLYFGARGVQDVEAAIGIFNNLPPVSQMSPNLTEFTQSAKSLHPQAETFGVLDLKSHAMRLLLEELGLAQAERWVFALRARTTDTNPDRTNYTVIQLNFDPVTLRPQTNINGIRWSNYTIRERQNPDVADAIEQTGDSLALRNTSVSSGILFPGEFYIGLSRDDVGGLRYLLRPNNFNVEQIAPGSFVVFTNRNAAQALSTIDLHQFLTDTVNTTNTPAQLQALYTNLATQLQIVSTNLTITNLPLPTVTVVLTGSPYQPAGSPSPFALATNYTTNVTTVFTYGIGNVVTNSFFTNGVITDIRTEALPNPYAPANSGLMVTNTTTSTTIGSFLSGSVYIIPTNLAGFSIFSTQLVQVLEVTNFFVSTNIVTTNNNVVVTNTFQEAIITYHTNVIFGVFPIELTPPANTLGLRPGVDKLTFVRINFDSLLGQTFGPVTNFYTDVAISNGVSITQTIQRRVTQPDILFMVQDLGLAIDNLTPLITGRTGTGGWINNDALNGQGAQGGPGLITPPVRIFFSNQLPFYFNQNPGFITGPTSGSIFFGGGVLIGGFFSGFSSGVWGSYDGSNRPLVIYPDSISIQDLENLILTPP